MPSSVPMKRKTKLHRHFKFLFSLDCLHIFHVAAAVIRLLHYFDKDYHFIVRAITLLILFKSFDYLYYHSSISRWKMLSVLTNLLRFKLSLFLRLS